MADDATAQTDVLNSTAQGQLKSIVERIERLNEEAAEIREQIKEVKAEAKGNGFDVKIIGKVVRIRKMDRAKRQEEEALTDLYLSALGELPLFEARDGALGTSDSNVKVTISTPGGQSVETDLATMKGVAADLDLYNQAAAYVRETGKASTTSIQRRLQIGYNRAASLIERMEREGVVGPPNHAGKREVLAVAEGVAA